MRIFTGAIQLLDQMIEVVDNVLLDIAVYPSL